MKKSLLLYLFVFAGLLAVYFYASGQNMLQEKNEDIQALRQEALLKNQLADSLFAEIRSAGAFNLVSNEEALSYLEDRGLNPSEVIQQVEEELILRNQADADHPLIPYEGMDGFFRINKIRLLNHKWVIASFSDGTYWGDVFISFEIDQEGRFHFTTEKALLYPND